MSYETKLKYLEYATSKIRSDIIPIINKAKHDAYVQFNNIFEFDLGFKDRNNNNTVIYNE